MRSRILALAVTASLAGCSAEGVPAPRSSALPPAAGIPAAPKNSTGAAAAEPVPSKAPRGELAVTVRKLSLNRGGDRPLPTTVWAPKTGGPYPLILFSHGLSARPADYAELTTAWARAGFVVAAPAYPHTSGGVSDFNVLDVLNQPVDASYVITRVLAELGGKRVDARRVAAAGHSAGGITTIGMFTGNRDSRLVAGVVLAGRQIIPAPFTGKAVPLLFVHGRKDNTVAYADGRAVYDAVQWPKALLSVTDGSHVSSGAELDRVIATTTDFWRWSLYGDQAARKRLTPDATEGGLATLNDRL